MYEVKTKENDSDVMQFIDKIENISKREDSKKLLNIFIETTGLEAKMWGESMIGFGAYHYKYDSGHEGDAMITGFSPRKAKISLYLTTSASVRETLLEKLGKHNAGAGCVYINKLSDINENVLRDFINQNVIFIREQYPKVNI